MSTDVKKQNQAENAPAKPNGTPPEGFRMVKKFTGEKRKTDPRMRTIRNLARSAKGTCDEIIRAISSGCVISDETISALAIIAGQCGATYEPPK